MDYSIIYIVVAVNIAFLIYRSAKAGLRYTLGYIIELVLVLGLFSLPFLRGWPEPPLSASETAGLIVVFSLAVFGPTLTDLAARVLAMRGRFGAATAVKTIALLFDWSKEARLHVNLLRQQRDILRFRIDAAIAVIERDLADGVPDRMEGAYLQNLILAYSYKREWAKVAAAFERLAGAKEKYILSTSTASAMRAYAEIGNWKRATELLDWLGKHASLSKGAGIEYALSRLRFHALRGEIELAATAAAELRSTRMFPPFFEPYWMGRANYHAGRSAEAKTLFLKSLEATPEKDLIQREVIREFLGKCDSGSDGRIMESLSAPAEKPVEEIFKTQAPREDIAFSMMLRGRTPVVWLLVALNVAMYLVTVFSGGATNVYVLEAHGSKVNEALAAGEWWRLISCSFLHYGLVHILFNMYALLFMGKVAEAIYGEEGFITTYVLSAVGASAASYVLTPNDAVGASGAIFGIVGLLIAFGIKYRTLVPTRYKTAFGMGLVPYVAAIMALGFLVMPGMDNWAHFAGLFCGAAAGFILTPEKLRIRRRRGAAGYAKAGVAAAATFIVLVGVYHVIEPAADGKRITTTQPYADGEIGITFELPRLWEVRAVNEGLFVDPYMTVIYGAAGDSDCETALENLITGKGIPVEARVSEYKSPQIVFAEFKLNPDFLKTELNDGGPLHALVYRIRDARQTDAGGGAAAGPRAVMFMFLVREKDLDGVRFVIEQVVRSVKFQ